MVNKIHQLRLIFGSINELPLGESIFHRLQKQLTQGVFSSERVEGNPLVIQIDLRSNQTMRPVFIHQEDMPQASPYLAH